MATISDQDSYPTHEWKSTPLGYPFQVLQAGRMIYYGRAQALVGAWEGEEGDPGYITLDGDLQTLAWNVPFQHRPVRLVLYHEDAAGNPSVANVAVDYYYRERGMVKWTRIGGGAMTTVTYNEAFGMTWERADGEYMLTLQGTNTHLMWVTPYNQYLQAYQRTGRRQMYR